MFTFQFVNDTIPNYVFFDVIVNFIIQKLKKKHTFLKSLKYLRLYSVLQLFEGF